jgi:hypothetical protein
MPGLLQSSHRPMRRAKKGVGPLRTDHSATIFIFGVVMATIFKYSDSLWAPIVTRSANDFGRLCFFGCEAHQWNVHHPLAIKGGLNPEVAKAVAEGRRPVQMAEDEAGLYDLIQELLHNRTVSDSTYARAVSKFGEQAIVDAVSISGYYTMVAMLLNTARTPLAPGVPAPLPAFP